MFHRHIASADRGMLHRLFFAIRPPIEVARRIIAAAGWFEDGGRLLRPEHLHVTIDILDDLSKLDPALVARLLRAGEAVRAAPFDIAFDMAAGSPRSIALRPRRKVAGLEALRQRIAAARGAAGLTLRDGYTFGAHMTLGYRDGAGFTQPIAPVGWRVDEFVLIDSHVGRTRHQVLGRWPLTCTARDDEGQLALF